MDVKHNPNSFKSTWRRAHTDQWTLYHWFYEILDIHQVFDDRPVPVHQKHEKVPYLPNRQLNAWVITFGCIPLAIHQAFTMLTGYNLPFFIAYFYYGFCLTAIAIHQLRLMRKLGHIHGFLDGDKHARDGVPDNAVKKTFLSLLSTVVFRPLLMMVLTYKSNKAPASINLAWLPVEICLYPIATDFWFYWYHRLMHEVGFLWKFHRTHHLTKHPNALLTIFADTEQEIFDIAVIPLLSYGALRGLGLPMGFYEFWLCHQFVIFTEILGHTGLRVHLYAASPISWLLRALNLELALEDHDLHHRSGWKNSHNYGKQTRVWDRLFGTCGNRIECKDDNIDYVNTASMPFF